MGVYKTMMVDTVVRDKSGKRKPQGRSWKRESRAELVQANKSTGRMPWHLLPMKDAAICEKPWGAESEH